MEIRTGEPPGRYARLQEFDARRDGEELELEGDGRRYAPLRFEDPQPRRIAGKYEDATDFLNKNACVCCNKKWGVIDTAGRLQTELKYDEIEQDKYDWMQVRIGNCYGYIDHQGHEKIPVKYHYLSHYALVYHPCIIRQDIRNLRLLHFRQPAKLPLYPQSGIGIRRI